MFLISRCNNPSIPECPYCLERIKLMRLLSGAMEVLLCPSCETEFTMDKYTHELELWLGKFYPYILTLSLFIGNHHQESQSENAANFSNSMKNYGNDLCRSCNHNQMIIMQLLHDYGNEEIPSTATGEDGEDDDEAFETYKRTLELKYPLCKLCRGVVRRKLDAQATLARANYLAAQAVRGKASILATNRRAGTRRQFLLYLFLFVFTLVTRSYAYNAASALFSFLLFCLYPTSLMYKMASFFVCLMRALVIVFLEDVNHPLDQVHVFPSSRNSIIVDGLVHICLINPDMLHKFFAMLKPTISSHPADRREKKQLELYREIVTKEDGHYNKENHPLRFSPRPSILSIPGTGIEESLALCSLHEDFSGTTKRASLSRFKEMFPQWMATCFFLLYLFISWNFLDRIAVGHIMSCHALGLVLYGEMIQAIRKRNLMFSMRNVFLLILSPLLRQMLLMNWHSMDRMVSIFCSFYSVTSILFLV